MASLTKHPNTWDHGKVSQIPRNSLIMLMTAFAMVVLPHAMHISIWVIGVGVFCVIWRWLIFLGRNKFPSFWLKTALVLTSAAGVVISEGVSKNLETWAALLIVAFALKLLEMKTQRDAYVLIFIAYFVIAVEFIFNNSMGIVAYEIFALILVTSAMVGMNQFHTRIKPFESIKISSKILIQALPLMIVLFVLFPRIGPLWSIASPSQKAKTGLSSQMTPGDIANLTRSDEIVFRAIFSDTPPSNSELYWRGRVYSNFENGTWSEAGIPKPFQNIPKVDWVSNKKVAWFIPETKAQSKISYSILLEPTHDQWLFGLDLALPQSQSTGVMWDYRLINRTPVQSLLRYEVDTYPDATLNTWLPEFLRIQTTKIEKSDNPRIINFARERYDQSNSTEEFVNGLLAYIQNQVFYYTLEPSPLDRTNSIDQFWFDTRRGFCAHYAGAFVYMLRTVGIPARMVGGYQGGEINPLTGHIVVRQYSAHAWVEYWSPNRGWQRIDPTAAVAPSRIENGLNAALPENELSSLSAFTNARLNGIQGLQKLMFLFESLEHRWNLFVIGYNSDFQSDFLQKILGKITITKIALVLFIGALISILFVSISLFLPKIQRHNNPVIETFNKFTSKLRKHGLNRDLNETPAQFIENISRQKGIHENEYIPIKNYIVDLLYNPDIKITKEKIRSLQSKLYILQNKLCQS